MNQLRRVLVGSICLLASTGGTALAQKTYALGLGGGATIPAGKAADTQKTGYHGLVALAIGVADLPLGVRFDGMYNIIRGNGDVVTAPGGGTSTNSDVRVAAALANLVFAFPGTTAKAYIIAGGGLYNSKPDTAGAKAQNNFGLNAGLGSTFGAGPVAIFLEARYHTVSRSVAKGGVYQFVPITLGFLF